jgi:DNA-binding FrmR family transcriptional regulator
MDKENKKIHLVSTTDLHITSDSHLHAHTHEHTHTHTHTNTKAVLNRLSKAIGHLSSVKGMVERGQDCSQVLIQLSAVRSAINGICEVILKDHLDHCIVDAVKTGDKKTIEELNKAIELLLK